MGKYCIHIILLLCLTGTIYQAKSQTSLSGYIKDEEQLPVSGVNINLLDSSGTIITYGISNGKGYFSLVIPKPSARDNILVAFSCIGYKKKKIPLTSISSQLQDYILETDTSVLSEVKVESVVPVRKTGDTIKYSVNYFAKPEDRNIGDVLKRLPGVNIADDGTIYFNGKKIENLYIHGDDLMSGRYGLAENAIKKEMITRVDVIENHQPKKILQNKIATDNTAINLVLKNENSIKLAMEATAGVGTPKLYDVSITPILLNKRFKALNTLAMNNDGIAYSNSFKQLGSANFNASLDNTIHSVTLSQGTVGSPDIPLRNYYFNNSKIVNLNDLYNFSDSLQLKTNLQFFFDRTSLTYNQSTVNTLGTGERIIYDESQSLETRPHLLDATFNVQGNKSSYFLNNALRIRDQVSNDNSSMLFGERRVYQSLHKRTTQLSNDFNWMPLLKGTSILEFRAYVNWNMDKQWLRLNGDTSIYPIADFDSSSLLAQNVRSPTFYSNVYFSYKRSSEHAAQDYKLGYIYEHQDLQSFLVNEMSGGFANAIGNGNDLSWNNRSLYFDPEYQFSTGKWRIFAGFPVALLDISSKDTTYSLHQDTKKFFFKPVLNIQYKIDLENLLKIGYNYDYSIGNITNVFRGGILTNYRTLVANNTDILPVTYTHSLNASYGLEKTLQMFFLNVGISYKNSRYNTVSSAIYTDNVQTITQLPYNNSLNELDLTNNISKYFFSFKGKVSLNSQLQYTTTTALINREASPIKAYALNVTGSLEKTFFGIADLTYKPGWSMYKSKIQASGSSNQYQRVDQLVDVSTSNLKNIKVSVREHYNILIQKGNPNYQYNFVDMSFEKRHLAKGLDMDMDIVNVFNIKRYMLYSLSANQSIQDYYSIRGRMFTIKFIYSF